MAELHLEIDHALTEKEVLKRVKHLFTDVQKQYGNKMSDVVEQWKGNRGTYSATIMGYDIEGKLEIKKEKVLIRGTIPWSLSLFKRKIEKVITDRARELLT